MVLFTTEGHMNSPVLVTEYVGGVQIRQLYISGDSSERQAAASLNNVKVRGRGKGLFRIVFGTQILGVSNCRSVLS